MLRDDEITSRSFPGIKSGDILLAASIRIGTIYPSNTYIGFLGVALRGGRADTLEYASHGGNHISAYIGNNSEYGDYYALNSDVAAFKHVSASKIEINGQNGTLTSIRPYRFIAGCFT